MTEPIVPPAGAAFRALLWKEFREATKWATIGLLIVAAMLWFAIAMGNSVMSDIVPGMQNGPFMLATIAVGLLIGFGQSIPENRGDKWGFFTHRPVSRSKLWAGKVVAGVLLYLAVTGLPFAWAMFWFATPGHRPMPFDIRMTQPGIADIMCGLVYYFAAALTSMRNANWYASRAVAIGAAFTSSALVVFVPEFWQAVLVSIVGVLTLGAAAWGTFVAGGDYGPQRRLTRTALAVSLVPGLTLAGAIAVTIIGAVLAISRPGSSDITNTEYEVASDGTLVKTTSVFHVFRPANGPEITKVEDLQGHPIARYATDSSRRRLTAGVITSAPLPLIAPANDRHGYRDLQRLFVRLISQEAFSAPVAWYYVNSLGRIVAYDVMSARRIGWLGPDGFSAGAPTGRTFTNPLLGATDNPYERSLLAFPDAVFRLELEKQRVVKVFSVSPDESVLGTSGATAGEHFFSSMSGSGSVSSVSIEVPRQFVTQADSERRRDSSFTAVATTKGVYALSLDGTRLLSTPHDPKAAGYGTVTVSRAPRGPGKPIFLWYRPERGTLPKQRWQAMPAQVVEYDSSGTVPIAHFVLPRIERAVVLQVDWTQRIISGLTTPIVIPISVTLYYRLKRLTPPSPQPATTWGIAFASAVLFVAVAFFIGRRYAFGRRRLWLWSSAGFIGGPLGIVLMLSVCEWPARETCPRCSRARVVNRRDCEHCGAAFDPPPLDGTEVFEVVPV